MLSQIELKRILDYNVETGEFKWLVPSRGYAVGDVAGWLSPKGYLAIAIGGKRYMCHRLAWLYVNGTMPIDQLDHINGIKCDNRLSNLREASNRENTQNQLKSHSDSKSGLLGVSWYKAGNKWRADIFNNGKQTHIGYFTNKHAAHEAYLAVKRKLHGFCTI